MKVYSQNTIPDAPAPLPEASGLSAPRRIQLRRTKGWRMPPNTVVVTRGPGKKWGNPWTLKSYEDAGWKVVSKPTVIKYCIEAYRAWLTGVHHWGHGQPLPPAPDLTPLRGKNLACFCPLDQPCHADVLLELANAEARASDEGKGPAKAEGAGSE